MHIYPPLIEAKGIKLKLINLFRGPRYSGPDIVWKYLSENISDYTNILPDWTWIVAGDISKISKPERELLKSKKILLGPNIHFENPRVAEIVNEWPRRKILVPSGWVKDYFETSGIESSDDLIVWASTVNSNEWKPRNVSRDSILIYIKDFQKLDLANQVIAHLESLGHKYSILNYGSYTKRDFKKTLDRSFAAIWIGGTESQGLALLETWFMNVPTLVLKCDVFRDGTSTNFLASSAPYLSTSCGAFFSDSERSTDEISFFLKNIDRFSPRDWAMKNFSHEVVLANLVNSLISELDN